MHWKETLTANFIPICILIVLILILVFSFRESYVGNPISNLVSWDSGNVLRRLGSQFSATNQGASEYMTGGRDPPYYTAPWQANADYGTSVSGTNYSVLPTSKTESYFGNKFEDKRLANNLY